VRKSCVFVILFCSVMLISQFSDPVHSFAQQTGTLTSCPQNSTFQWTLVRPPASLNPLTFITGTAFIFLLEYPGATDYLWNGSDVSYMLSGWTHNENYTQWTLNIKPGLLWSNGDPVTSQDLLTSEGPKFAFNLTYNYLGLAQQVSDEYGINDSEATFVLNATNTHFIDELSLDGQGGTPVLPASVIDEYGAAYPNLGTDLSMGPFYVYDYPVSSAQMVMLRNPYFSPQPNICQIDVSFVETLSLTADRLEAGQADLAPLNPFDISSVLKNPSLHVLDEKEVGAASLEYNDSVYPYNQLPFRQALVYGINQTEFVQDSYDGYGVEGYSSESAVPPSAGIWYNPNTTRYEFDPARAASLLASIGFTKNDNGYLTYPNGTAASVTLWTDVDNTEDTSGAAVIEQNLQHLGFQVSLQTTTAANIAADYGANTDGIRNDIILFSGFVLNPSNPLVDALPACNVEWLPAVCGHNFLWPPSVDAEYQSNFTSFMSTANVTLEQKYLYNIQSLDSENLPTTILAYPDYVWGYSTSRWTNWPPGHMDEGLPQVPNMTAWETLAPVSSLNGTDTHSNIWTYWYVGLGIAAVAVITGIWFRRVGRRRKAIETMN